MTTLRYTSRTWKSGSSSGFFASCGKARRRVIAVSRNVAMGREVNAQRPRFRVRGVSISLAVLLSFITTLAGAETRDLGIQWRTWSDDLLEEARGEGRFLLLDLTASWCAFCQKMKTVTYRDRGVEAVVREHYIPVRIDDEDDPALAARYADYGRPASVVLNADGRELIRRRGFMEPLLMTWMLQAVAQNPDPEAHR